MEKNIAIINIIIENIESVSELNKILSNYGHFIIGRLGIPYHRRKTNIICVVIDASKELIKEFEDKIKSLDGIYCNLFIK